MSFPKTIEHSKHYLVNIQIFGDRIVEDNPLELNYLATSFEINHSGGSDFVHQKGNSIASVFATQPTISIRVNCFMTEPDFAVLITAIITEQQQILISVGKLDSENIKTTAGILPQVIDDDSALIFEAIGYMKDAQISASVGQFVSVNFTINADDINKIRLDDQFRFNGIPSFKP